MSIVVCRMTENGYEMAADSIAVRGYTQGRTTKLVEANGMVIGSSGTLEETVLFKLFASTRRPSTEDEAGILEFMSEFYDWKKKKTDSGRIENAYLLGFAGKVFMLQEWLANEVKEYDAIGAGMDYALAALYLGHSAEEAVNTAIHLSVYCEPPIVVIKRP